MSVIKIAMSRDVFKILKEPLTSLLDGYLQISELPKTLLFSICIIVFANYLKIHNLLLDKYNPNISLIHFSLNNVFLARYIARYLWLGYWPIEMLERMRLPPSLDFQQLFFSYIEEETNKWFLSKDWTRNEVFHSVFFQ